MNGVPVDGPASVTGRVLDATALVAWIRGSLAMATWRSMAFEQLAMLLVPSLARTEALALFPEAGDHLDVLLRSPVTVVAEMTETDRLAALSRLDDGQGLDPLAVQVALVCGTRNWPALTDDADRLRRVNPAIETEVV